MRFAENSAGLQWQASLRRAFVMGAGILGLAGVATAANLPGLQSGPLVQVVDVDEREDHADISVQFACSVRFIGNRPLDHGSSTTITLKLGADCGSLLNGVTPELPVVGGNTQLVSAARVESIMPGEVTLELSWSKELNFVMAPTASGLGLRVRLLGTNHKKASVLLSDVEEPYGYSVNLDSSQKPIDAEKVQAAAAQLQAQAFVSETDIEDQHWYRLRIGPFTTRKEAERVLQLALPQYPRAWLAVNDEQTGLTATEHAGTAAITANASTDPALPDDQRAKIMGEARAALEKHKYPEAVDLLTRLVRQPEFSGRADAQELMGLVRERAGQLAQAKAEYEAYLRQYPNGPAAARVRGRLQSLAAASLTPRSTGDFTARANSGWSLAGSTALTYQYGKNQTNTGTTSINTTAVNAALVYGDLLLRDRGERYDFTARVNAGYTENFLKTTGGNQDRTTAAYIELTDRTVGVTGRLGRQSLASQGSIGLFDGLYVGYQANSKISVSAAAGYPAYTSYSSFSSQQKFATVAAEFGPYRQSWVFDTYLFNETDQGYTNRRSIGLQTRFSVPGVTSVVLVDYDFYFQKLNSVTFIGNLKVGPDWILGFDVDHRSSPQLQLSNALAGQSETDLKGLQYPPAPPSQTVPPTPPPGPLTIAQIKQLALDRTATSDTYVVSASRALGDRWQFLVDLATLKLGGTPASPAIFNPSTEPNPSSSAVAATTSTGLDKSASVQLSGASLIQASDLHIFGLRVDNSPSSKSTALSWDARFALPGSWRLGPRLSVEEIKNPSVGGKQRLYLPQVRGDWTSRRSIFELTAGYQLQRQQAVQLQTGQSTASAVDQRSLYISAAYRLRF